jgi:SAM-dependent methyltransferase
MNAEVCLIPDTRGPMPSPQAPPAPPPAAFEETHHELWDLENFNSARRLGDWMFEQFAPFARGDVVEVGAGIGTFSRRVLAHGVESLLLIEPEPPCADLLERGWGADSRVTVARETLPESRALRGWAGRADFVLCQNVLEHVPDDGPAVNAMADALRPGGHLTLLVPAHPRLYGRLDRLYHHHRRYTPERLQRLAADAGLEVVDLYPFNLLGVPGWWVNKYRRRPRVSRGALRVYEALLRAWKPIEERRRPPWGLSLILHARRPG